MDQQLLLGIALIVVGIAVGLIAAAVVVNRRMDEREQAQTSAEERETVEPAERVTAAEQEADVMPDGQPEEQPAAAEAVDQTSEATGEADSPAEAQPESEDSVPERAESEPHAAERDSLLGELHRDPQSGRLFFRSGGREYRSASDIEDQTLRDQLAGAASDWSDWFREQPRTAAAPAQSPTGMVQAIDAILQRSLQDSGVSTRGVRLIQDLSGGVKVLIGVKSYEVDEVPDAEIRRLIRQAVAEWEEQR